MGSPKGPVKKLKRALSKACTVVDVDEHRTSKLHLDCRFRMQNMISWKMAKWKGDTEPRERKVKIHSVLHCPNSKCHGMTVNRDTNAARNMLQLLLDQSRGLERHICFRRGTPVTEHAHDECGALPERAGARLPE
ncbi:hypothetical protein EDD86DRAFT_97504 [Gorgonomyces haynaldii]|nr:hypothetical protein EDD86DRAFT_97504 [Gorgonomyces haynaldii]